MSAETLRPVLDLILAGEPYRLAVNGRYSLHRPLPPDAFGVVAHLPVNTKTTFGLSVPEVDALVQLLGTYIEENGRLKAALAKGAE